MRECLRGQLPEAPLLPPLPLRCLDYGRRFRWRSVISGYSETGHGPQSAVASCHVSFIVPYSSSPLASAGASAASFLTGLGISLSRTLASISLAISRFSSRNLQAFALPWPILSPL